MNWFGKVRAELLERRVGAYRKELSNIAPGEVEDDEHA
jgi:hypothetical protein